MRKTYDRDFKLKVSRDILDKKVTIKSISEEYNISRPTISRWVSEYRRYGNKAFAGQGKRLPDKADFYILEQENKRLNEENEILKKFDTFVKQKNSSF
ncbi:helix-turn-helix domain-containing protein [Listeria seeligeri]|uniref:helix-turn-helix domain-containing protein n=1 Tax=Listeria seeligeri TaxID=1640 RepID=UPI0022EBCEB8|nr:helix-turn-helix domain-containing protein [Listeria seeligeri]